MCCQERDGSSDGLRKKDTSGGVVHQQNDTAESGKISVYLQAFGSAHPRTLQVTRCAGYSAHSSEPPAQSGRFVIAAAACRRRRALMKTSLSAVEAFTTSDGIRVFDSRDDV